MIACITLPVNFWGTVLSTLLGVIVGFILNYLRDLRKDKKDKKIKKTEIIRKIVSTCKWYDQFEFMNCEVISTMNYFKARNNYIDEKIINDKKVPIEMIESWRKDHENYRFKIFELETNLSEYISVFHAYFGKNEQIDLKRNKIDLMKYGFFYTFETHEKVKEYSESKISDGIARELNKEGQIAFLLKDLIKYVQNLQY